MKKEKKAAKVKIWNSRNWWEIVEGDLPTILQKAHEIAIKDGSAIITDMTGRREIADLQTFYHFAEGAPPVRRVKIYTY